VYFERRRLTLAGILAFVAGYALYAHVNATALGLPFPVFTGFLYAVLVVLAAAMTSYIFPKLRRLIDGVAVSRLGFAIWVIIAQGQEIAGSPLICATIVVGGAIILLRLSNWIDRLSRTPTAPVIFVNVAARARAAVAWLDNAAVRDTAVRDGANYPATISIN
jgi:MFS family permease